MKALSALTLSALAGGSAMFFYDRIPNDPEQYTVTAKQTCLPPEGITLRLGYRGTGTVDIIVLPPNPAKTPEKEKKQ
jgi:hypothetical protein